MSVQTEIDRIIGAVEDAHEKVLEKGGTTSRPYLVGNLASAIDSISAGEDVTDETEDYTTKLITLENAITALETTLEGKASGGSGGGSVNTCTVRLVEGSETYFGVGYTNENMEYVYANGALTDGFCNTLTNVACGTILYLNSGDNMLSGLLINGGTLISSLSYRTYIVALDQVQNDGEVVIEPVFGPM